MIIGADCLFFVDYHDDLIRVLSALLEKDGIAIFIQPRRSGTMEAFVKKAGLIFDVEVEENYLREVCA